MGLVVKSIFLQDGSEVFLDDDDYEKAKKYTWVKRQLDNVITAKIDSKNVTLKRFLFGNEIITQIAKGNDYTKGNMIKESPKRHSRAWNKSKSKYKGVSWSKRQKYWTASIYVDGKNKWLGGHPTEEAAAEAYNKAVDVYRGGEGFKNVIGESSRAEPRSGINVNDKRKLPRIKSNEIGYRGVSKNQNKKLRVRINYRAKQIDVVYSETNKDRAALIYNKVALYLYAENARLNNVPMTDELKEFISNWEIPEKIKKLKED